MLARCSTGSLHPPTKHTHTEGPSGICQMLFIERLPRDRCSWVQTLVPAHIPCITNTVG